MGVNSLKHNPESGESSADNIVSMDRYQQQTGINLTMPFVLVLIFCFIDDITLYVNKNDQ